MMLESWLEEGGTYYMYEYVIWIIKEKSKKYVKTKSKTIWCFTRSIKVAKIAE